MKTSIRQVVIFIILAAVFVLLVIFRHMASKIVYNDDFVNGNTAGNLYNQGLFCEKDGTIYFSNPDDSFHLYSMDLNGSNLNKISDDVANYINADSTYIYYVRNNSSIKSDFSFLHFDTNSLCRVKSNGKNAVVLDHDPCIYVSLLGNTLYYLHYDKETATTLYKTGIDGKDRTQVFPDSYFTCSTNGKYLYYNGLESDHKVYVLDTETDSMSVLLDCNAWMPVVIDRNVYYMDCNNDYALVKTNLDSNETTVLTTDRVDCFNVYGDQIYYQRNDSSDPALCRIKTDGSDQMVIASGNHTSINITSQYVYFMNYGDDTTIYYTPLSGTASVSAFHPGK